MKLKITKKRFALAILSISLLCGGIYTSSHIFSKNEGQVSENISVIENGISIKMLSTTEKDGVVTKTFTYTITPSNATNQKVSAVAKYTDGSDCSSVLTVTVDNDKKTISLVNKLAFNKQINVVVTSLADSTKKATLKVDYTKKLLSITSKQEDEIVFGKTNSVNSFKILDLVTPNYSVYTKDKQYTFEVKDIACATDEIDFNDQYFASYVSEVENNFNELIENKVKNKSSFFTAEEIYNLSDTWQWHSALATKTSDSFISMELYATYYCVEDPSIEVEWGGWTYFYFDIFDSFGNVEVGSLDLEIDNIEF